MCGLVASHISDCRTRSKAQSNACQSQLSNALRLKTGSKRLLNFVYTMLYYALPCSTIYCQALLYFSILYSLLTVPAPIAVGHDARSGCRGNDAAGLQPPAPGLRSWLLPGLDALKPQFKALALNPEPQPTTPRALRPDTRKIKKRQ